MNPLPRAEQMTFGVMCVNLGCQRPATERVGGLAYADTHEPVVLPLCEAHAVEWKRRTA